MPIIESRPQTAGGLKSTDPAAGCRAWAIITGEYPPQVGGVSDFTRLVAHGLAAQGDEVDVWAPVCSGPPLEEGNVRVHRLPGHFGFKALSILRSDLKRMPESCRVLVQYVPHSFGWKAMNIPFCVCIAALRRQPLWILFHEVAFPFHWKQPLKHNFLAIVTRGMAWLLSRRAQRIFVSIPAWESLLPKKRRVTRLPIPSTIPTTASPEAVAQIRSRYAPGSGQLLIGNFGTFGAYATPLLNEIIPPLMNGKSDRLLLLLGKGGQRFREELLRRHPHLDRQVTATGALPADLLASHIAACDILIQPYSDGVSARRTSVMAGFALGVPIVTTEGPHTEPVWRRLGAVALAPAESTTAFVAATEALLADPSRRARIHSIAVEGYEQHFALTNTIRELRL